MAKAKVSIIPKSEGGAPRGTPVRIGNQEDREAWLMRAVELLKAFFLDRSGIQIPKVRVSVGWPGGRQGKKALGSCWAKEASEDGSYQIFISPTLSGSVEVLACLVHELCHACTDVTGHGKPFRDLAAKVGLLGKPTATYPDQVVVSLFAHYIHKEGLGEYPHAKLNPEESGMKKQGTRMIKCTCPVSGYSCRTTREWLREFGAPLSPKTGKPMEFDQSVLTEEGGGK